MKHWVLIALVLFVLRAIAGGVRRVRAADDARAYEPIEAEGGIRDLARKTADAIERWKARWEWAFWTLAIGIPVIVATEVDAARWALAAVVVTILVVGTIRRRRADDAPAPEVATDEILRIRLR